MLVAIPGASALLGYRGAADALEDRRGELVRETPTRCTWRTELADGTVVFRKLRTRRARDAEREWRALDTLAELGIRVPRGLLVARSGMGSALVMHACPGPALSDWILARGADADLAGCVLGPVLALVRRLHAAGFAHRDLYWNHLLIPDLRAHEELALIDVERLVRSRLRRRRFLEKDLAALLGSWPLAAPPRTLALRFLRGWLGGALGAGWKRLARRVLARARRIREHVPRHGSPPLWRRGESVRSP